MKAKEYIIEEINKIMSKMSLLQLEALLQAIRKITNVSKLK